MGLVYIACVYIVYFLVGLGLLRATSLVQGHWLGQLGAALLILFGVTNLLGCSVSKFSHSIGTPRNWERGTKEMDVSGNAARNHCVGYPDGAGKFSMFREVRMSLF